MERIPSARRPEAIKRGSTLFATMLFVGLASFTYATADESDAAPAADPARPAIGDWVGHVSWNAPLVNYAWQINPDGTFNSGRLGRGASGGGAWRTDGAQLSLKYTDGFRYEGELRGDAYGGTAYSADGRALGGFSMWRQLK